ncbi:hypothetical protein SNOG_01974 [Parastagonospora nodorum SN15]|uniref:Uncharacterized protein n=1 Tax=Phaeosphaeria nodorum (strain SN15 / ATCC MYA-4574 / FGSC 10173) TaxID=321614 RepID=Q0V1Z0_PHANO|nr:hypothetical protein SNOG_01974 [Parastagonospora nodorum SN15]EAT90186.1 hypothetical protein SNOG_01974 [Parastagonospora nodorum SN15]
MNLAYDPVSYPESAPVSRASTPQLPGLEYTLSGLAFEDTPPTSPAASTPPMLPVQAPTMSYGVLAGVAYVIFGEGQKGAVTIFAWLVLFVIMAIINTIWMASQASRTEETLPAQVMVYEPQTNAREQTVAATLIILGYIFLAYCLYQYFNVLVLTIAAEFILVVRVFGSHYQ